MWRFKAIEKSKHYGPYPKTVEKAKQHSRYWSALLAERTRDLAKTGFHADYTRGIDVTHWRFDHD